jgi:hypothetical protein
MAPETKGAIFSLPSFLISEGVVFAMIDTPSGGCRGVRFDRKSGAWVPASYIEASWEGRIISALEAEAAVGSEGFSKLPKE